jgi:hypothetical protein
MSTILDKAFEAANSGEIQSGAVQVVREEVVEGAAGHDPLFDVVHGAVEQLADSVIAATDQAKRAKLMGDLVKILEARPDLIGEAVRERIDGIVETEPSDDKAPNCKKEFCDLLKIVSPNRAMIEKLFVIAETHADAKRRLGGIRTMEVLFENNLNLRRENDVERLTLLASSDPEPFNRETAHGFLKFVLYKLPGINNPGIFRNIMVAAVTDADPYAQEAAYGTFLMLRKERNLRPTDKLVEELDSLAKTEKDETTKARIIWMRQCMVRADPKVEPKRPLLVAAFGKFKKALRH